MEFLRTTACYRHCERSEAIHRAEQRKLDCFASLAMTRRVSNFNQPNVRIPAARLPGLCRIVLPNERALGAVSCARCTQECAHEHTMVFRLMPRAPWRRIRLASIASELTVRIVRLSFANLRRLDASNGRQDHTVLPYAASSAKTSTSRVPANRSHGGSV